MMFGLEERFTYLECGKCGCVQLATPPDDLGRYYPPGYYSLSNGIVSRMANHLRDEYAYSLRGLLGRAIFSLFPKYGLRTIREQDWSRSARILDVGCGTGTILRVLARHGYIHLHGIDPYLACDLEVTPTLRVEKRSVEAMTGIWDVVMFNHSFEHIPEQQAALRHVRRLLAPDGVCFLRIPTTTSYAWKHYGVNWVSLDAPRHFFLHSHTSIAVLAAQAGFGVHAIAQESTAFQFWASEQYGHGIPLMSADSCMTNPLRALRSWRQIRRYQAQADALNLSNRGDEIAVIMTPVSEHYG
jgi:SAM-dependent methyltransferase